ncbi:NitT/TauT family transport system ATP-binding protein [Salinibacillus kushneri]|uniref:Carnitine transport ATP-binding protein OpuCA n=1 Tax=Salinibacillus kushneri TaxID=237682 RepID=A0A1I0G1H4_9BACI|nr:ABC transporter ATP-binding protein [Salinibacillus kushneri]SET64681.1 NitT/TauT family transport system ATP-binding protein [Salinibacillus kushneri]
MSYLHIENVNKSFQRNTKRSEDTIQALQTINLSIHNGEFVSLLGTSGCGKSTLLSMIAGLSKPSSGSISLAGNEIKEPGPDKSVVFQEPALFPWMSVKENVTFPLRQKMNKKDQENIALHYLQMVQLSQFANQYPHELSGGMQQRVAIARALAMDANLLLMDEPFGALDEQTRTVMQDELEKIWMETQKTIVFVTHSIREAVKLSDRIMIMSARPGTIISDFKVDLKRPRQQKDLALLEEEIMAILKKEIDNVMKEELQYANHR